MMCMWCTLLTLVIRDVNHAVAPLYALPLTARPGAR